MKGSGEISQSSHVMPMIGTGDVIFGNDSLSSRLHQGACSTSITRSRSYGNLSSSHENDYKLDRARSCTELRFFVQRDVVASYDATPSESVPTSSLLEPEVVKTATNEDNRPKKRKEKRNNIENKKEVSGSKLDPALMSRLGRCKDDFELLRPVKKCDNVKDKVINIFDVEVGDRFLVVFNRMHKSYFGEDDQSYLVVANVLKDEVDGKKMCGSSAGLGRFSGRTHTMFCNDNPVQGLRAPCISRVLTDIILVGGCFGLIGLARTMFNDIFLLIFLEFMLYVIATIRD